jgi:hypothetical protein
VASHLCQPAHAGPDSIPQIGRQHIGYAVLNGIALPAGGAAELARHYLLLVLLEYLKGQVSFAEGTGQNIKQIAFHGPAYPTPEK